MATRTRVTRKQQQAGDITEMGPIDYILIEWPDRQPRGEAIPYLIDLVDRGLVRVLDVTFLTKEQDGSVTVLEVSDLDDVFREFEGASSGLIDQEDLMEAASVLEPGTSAALLIWENSWAAPFAVALRRSGAQLAASGRVPVQALVAAIEAAVELTEPELLAEADPIELDRFERIASLHARGVLDDDEYEAARRVLLDRVRRRERGGSGVAR